MSAVITIKLIPSIQKDEKTGLFSARFKMFPAAIVNDETIEKATSRLIAIFELMVDNERGYILDTVNTTYGTSFKVDTAMIELSKNVKYADHKKEQQLELKLPTEV